MPWPRPCSFRVFSMSKASSGTPAADGGVETIKLRLVIAYDGTNYSGWQFQKSGTAVQELVEKAVEAIFPGGHHVHGCSRTDSGVHARGLVAHLEFPKSQLTMQVRRIRLALNARLPEEIRVVEAKQVPVSFHARFHSTGKQYRYAVWNHAVMNPLLLRYAWHVPHQLDMGRIRETATVFQGRHDFRSFATNHIYHVADTVRTLTRVSVQQSGPQLTFIIEGNSFLYRMCRSIVGTLIQTGRGRFSTEDVRAMLLSKDRTTGGMSAPAHGLVLWKVFYRRQGKGVPGPGSDRGADPQTDSMEEGGE